MRRLLWCTLLAGVLAGCPSPQGSNSGKVFVFGKAKDAVKLDPADISDGESSTVTGNIFEGLLQFADEATTVEPALATSWTISPDGLTYTFKLRDGVKFHDGTPLDAEAVKFNFDRQRLPKHPYRFDGHFEYWGYFFKDVTDVVTPDKMTVVLKISKPDATFLTNLALFTMGISSPAAIKQYGQDYFKHPVGTGPFKFKKWVPMEKIVLERNDAYWGSKPKVERLIFKPVPDNAVRLLELENGSVHGVDGINPDDVARIKQNPKLKLISQPGMNVGYLAFNMLKKPLDNRQVRQAMNMAINKQALVNAFFSKGELGMVAINPIPPVIWGYNDQVKDFPYDPDGAKRLLAEAGYPNGFDLELWAMSIARPYMPQPQQVAESIQSDLQKIGIRAKIKTVEWGMYLNKLANGEHEAALGGWIGDNGDPDNFLYTLLDPDNAKPGSASNYAFYNNPKVHDLLLRARQVTDQKVRSKLYQEAQLYIKEDAPWATLFHATQFAAVRSHVDGFRLHPTGRKLFRGVGFAKGAP